MSWTLLASAKGNGASAAVCTAFDSTGSKLLVIETAGSGTPTVTETIGGGSVTNTWQSGTFYNGTTPNTKFLYCISPANVGANHVITVSGSVVSAVVSAWTCTNTPVLDSQSTPNAATAAAGQFGASSFTPTVNGCLLLTGCAWANPSSSIAAGTGWTMVDSQPYVGGTSFGTSCAYKIQSTATAVPTSEQTITWTPSQGYVFNGIAFAESVSSSVTITTPKQYEVHQRSGSTGSIQISGTTAGATEDIEASFNGGAYVTIASAVAPGGFSGTLTGQAQGQGTLTVRKKVTTSASATVTLVGVGENFLDGGDSIDEGRGTNGQVYSHATLKAGMFKSGVWAELADAGANTGTAYPLLATLLMADLGVPVSFTRTGVGGTDVAGTHDEWAKNNAQYAAAVSAASTATASYRAVLMQLGPNGIVNGNNVAIALATYQTAATALGNNFAGDVTGGPKTHIGIPGEVTTGAPPDRTTAENNIRGAILGAWAAGGNVKNGPNLLGQTYSDGVHPRTDAQLLELAQRWYLCLKEAYFGGAVGSSRGPRLVSATWNAGRNQMTVVFDRVLKTGLTHATGAWRVSDNGTPMTISSVAYHGSNTSALLVNTSAAATGGAGTTTLTFGSGEDATGLVIPKSADITLPVGGPIQIPAEPFYAATVSEVDTTAPTLSSPSASATSSTTATGSFTTNEAGGTAYALVTTNATETGATVKASGAAQSVPSTGVQSASFSGLTPSTTYYPHYLQTDAALNDSAVANGAAFTTPAAAAPASSGGTARVALTAAGQLIVLLP